jgi:lipopolysaccharide/colanic/teichoic acid biosynthesis glycosyltransferase
MRSFYARYGKRGCDVTIAAATLVLLAPVAVVIAAIVLVTLGRPIFFTQRRTGLHGRIFTLIKFRTMTRVANRTGIDAETDGVRMTRAGALLRRLSLDEVPQLVNVLRGDMSLVGPRPLLPEYLSRYSPQQAMRHDVKPGITGLAQVRGRNALSWEQKFDLDVRYVRDLSFALDVRILVRTVTYLIRGTGMRHPGHATMPEFRGTSI